MRGRLVADFVVRNFSAARVFAQSPEEKTANIWNQSGISPDC